MHCSLGDGFSARRNRVRERGTAGPRRRPAFPEMAGLRLRVLRLRLLLLRLRVASLRELLRLQVGSLLVGVFRSSMPTRRRGCRGGIR